MRLRRAEMIGDLAAREEAVARAAGRTIEAAMKRGSDMACEAPMLPNGPPRAAGLAPARSLW